MNFALDILPIILFFAAFKYKGIYLATAIAILASLLQVIYGKIKHGSYNKMHLISFLVILLLGSATLLSKNTIFVKWKVTVVYWVFALIFYFMKSITKKTVLEHLLEKNHGAIKLKPQIWQLLNVSWVLFFTIMGTLNLYIVYNFDTNTWVNFKMSTIIITLVFTILQGIVMAKNQLPEEDQNENQK